MKPTAVFRTDALVSGGPNGGEKRGEGLVGMEGIGGFEGLEDCDGFTADVAGDGEEGFMCRDGGYGDGRGSKVGGSDGEEANDVAEFGRESDGKVRVGFAL